jgi:hypothetical protein
MSCLHQIPGRVRVRVAGVKRDPSRACALAAWLQSQEGVVAAVVSPVTGSALIHYRAAATSADRLLSRMRAERFIDAPPVAPIRPMSVSAARRPRIENAIAGLVVRTLAEAVLERSLVALVAAVL